MTDTATLPIELRSLHVYPVKSCGGASVGEALLIETGLEFDRAWMLVDADGEFVSQRELPRMALVATQLRHSDLVLRAPGMLALHLALDAVEQPTRVRVWNDEVAAYDMGALAAQWFSDFLRQPLRLVRFDPEHKRLSAKSWTGPIDAENAFSDGFPLLVISQASLDGLNDKLAAVGREPVPMSRFRPNLVIASSELDAHGEDHLDEIVFDTPDGPVRLKLVKPCPRCPIPDIDPATGLPDDGTLPKVSDVLAGYRADARVGGAVTFGMNAVIVEGIDRVLRVGAMGRAMLAF
jgi:uncharacterized protein